MTAPLPPRFDERRHKLLLDELTARARLWLPEWRPGERMTDPMSAVLNIAARLGAEVTQRLDRIPEKSFRGMLHWLGKRGRTGQAARLPVVFKMMPGSEPILATAPIQLQADAGGTPVIFETEDTLRLMPSKLEALFAARPAVNKFHRAFPGLDSLEAPKPAPDEWQLRAPAPIGSKNVQLDPPEGLEAGMVLSDDNKNRYRVEAAKDGLVTLSHGIGFVEEPDPLPPATPAAAYDGHLYRVTAFSPFDGYERDLQEHALYLGADDKLNIKTPAAIELVGDVLPNAVWSYWGKKNGDSDSGWQDFQPKTSGLPNVLVKGEGEIEKHEINGVKLRWLRAVPSVPNDSVERQYASSIKFKVNCGEAARDLLRKLPAEQATAAKPAIEMEAIANTTPVVLDRGFYPFGREPRLFDAFYLSCPEAFAKPNAYASIDIRLGDGFAAPLNSVGEGKGYSLVVGIGNDQKLHPLFVDATENEPKPHFIQASPLTGTSGHPVAFPPQKVGAAYLFETAFFSATDGTEVWLWRPGFALSRYATEFKNDDSWLACGGLDSQTLVETCLVSNGSGLKIYALAASGAVYSRLAYSGTWAEVPVKVGDANVPLDRLVPIVSSDMPPGADGQELGLAGITRNGKLIYCGAAGLWIEIGGFSTTPTKPKTDTEDATVAPYPLAIMHNEALHLYVRGRKTENGKAVQTLAAFRINPLGSEPQPKSVRFDKPIVGNGFSFVDRETNEPAVFFICEVDGASRLAFWQPFTSDEPHVDDGAQQLPLPIEQPPVRLARQRLLFPLARAAVALSDNLAEPFIKEKQAAAGLMAIAQTATLPNDPNAKLVLEIPSIAFAFATRVGLIGLEYSPQRPPAGKFDGNIHTISPRRRCNVIASNAIDLEDDDSKVKVKVDALLCITESRSPGAALIGSIAKVTEIAPATTTAPRVAKLDVHLTGNLRRYYHVVTETLEAKDVDVRPTIMVSGHFELGSNAGRTDFIVLLTAGQRQVRARLFLPLIPENGNDRLVLADEWPNSTLPVAGDAVQLVSALAIGEPVSPPAPRNPELSWEYWNGSSWWQIPDVKDGTQHLVNTGVVQFCVPPDLQPSEVVGRQGTWIRVRLVGGDYGQETVRLVTPKGENAQVVVRDTSSIRAPYIVRIGITYEVCCAMAPDCVLTLDNGAYVDQTEINLTPNAEVAVFTPLQIALASPVPAAASAKADSACCEDRAGSAAADAAPKEPNESESAIYLGFSDKLHGSSIAIFFQVEETRQASDLPLEVEAYAANAFKKLQVKDDTHALSETGVLTIDCPEPLQQVSFFGRALHWLRLKRPAAMTGDWLPQIRGIHLNSVWATAAETRRNEIVGQSDGSPAQRFALDHVPVLEDTLELCVREPIGDDEKEELAKSGRHDVEETIGLWQGPWVRWLPGDLATASPTDRIFDFDATLGVITFGDGVQGATPPIGTDNIVAVTYRSGGAAAGNLVTAWSKLNLISPLPSIEETVTPEGAAGGSDPQESAAALRFASANIAMRERAVTLRDFELNALQFSPDVAQAKAFLRQGGITLVVIMRGRISRPSNAVRRDMARRLRAMAAPAMRRPGALVIEEPIPVSIDVRVILSIADLAQSGPISDAVEAAILGLLDPGSGGLNGQGWPLGATVTETHIAAAMADIRSIEEIAAIEIRRSDGVDAPLTAKQLAILPESGVTIEWRQAEVEAA